MHSKIVKFNELTLVYRILPINFFIKISPIEQDCNSHKTEIDTYTVLRKSSMSKYIVNYVSDHVIDKQTYAFQFCGETLDIDFSFWHNDSWREWMKFQNKYRVLVTRSSPGFDPMNKITISERKLDFYVSRIMTVVYHANKEHNFVHGDLLMQNILINTNTHDIKLFDFDLSTINQTQSDSQSLYENHKPIFSGKTGFLFDFFRLWSSILYVHPNYNTTDRYVYALKEIYNDSMNANDMKYMIKWINRLCEDVDVIYSNIVRIYVKELKPRTKSKDSVNGIHMSRKSKPRSKSIYNPSHVRNIKHVTRLKSV